MLAKTFIWRIFGGRVLKGFLCWISYFCGIYISCLTAFKHLIHFITINTINARINAILSSVLEKSSGICLGTEIFKKQTVIAVFCTENIFLKWFLQHFKFFWFFSVVLTFLNLRFVHQFAASSEDSCNLSDFDISRVPKFNLIQWNLWNYWIYWIELKLLFITVILFFLRYFVFYGKLLVGEMFLEYWLQEQKKRILNYNLIFIVNWRNILIFIFVVSAEI